ncbi:MAG: hypothetical protein ACE5FF_14540 [Saprospiraceae bacterium]
MIHQKEGGQVRQKDGGQVRQKDGGQVGKTIEKLPTMSLLLCGGVMSAVFTQIMQ